ncbi:MAG: plasmid mobilization relaxosome protein MobC [Ruminiclostridium sp.]|nr:plasmid mobilization relaxosome protein MobC [Ruminiclostridium sp.]
MENRARTVQIKFFVTEQERDVIRQRMELIGTTNLSAYMRKISQDGFLYTVTIDGLPEICKAVEAIGQNINQVAKRVNSTNTIYAEDIRQMKSELDRIWDLLKKILSKIP